MTLRELVFDALHNAHENGAFAPGGSLHFAPHREIAADLMDCDACIAEIDGVTVDEIVPHVIAWRCGAAE